MTATKQKSGIARLLENGHITEEGKHYELLENNGLYARYWNTQQTTRGWKLKKQLIMDNGEWIMDNGEWKIDKGKLIINHL